MHQRPVATKCIISNKPQLVWHNALGRHRHECPPLSSYATSHPVRSCIFVQILFKQNFSLACKVAFKPGLFYKELQFLRKLGWSFFWAKIVPKIAYKKKKNYNQLNSKNWLSCSSFGQNFGRKLHISW
jgi:hypothetical protein